MSEFTYGNIIRTEDKAIIFKHLSSGTPYIELNDRWLAFFTKEDGEQRSSDLVEELSIHCPVLYFYNLEDHFWGFEILNQGEFISSFHFSYELEGELEYDIASERYPDVDLFGSVEGEKVFEEVQTELQNPDVLEREIRKHFESVNAEDFQLFGVNEEAIRGLKQLLTAETFLNSQWDAVDRFKEFLDLTQMSWIRYDRTENRENIQYV
ncbi:hypothetical protein [Paenibacillus methanolicus]|uniref:Uncharacterized protein n=1 Tax=Paenibacillus methanolicus TaxID=582686 RepID=A0A5S5BY73_9BACL|nr:hypothetical protein [Paenibacillus methanolicus]TYP71987.1 hypothetical protein BCM02_109266 [Paenibacillus methanolicus]